MINAIGHGTGALTMGNAALEGAKINSESGKFSSILKEMNLDEVRENQARAKVEQMGKLNGDWTTGFSGTYTSEADKTARPQGAAANQSLRGEKRTIDRTSKLYESALALESYLVKQMLGEMRKTVLRADGEGSQAKKIYEDMLFDEYAVSMTKGAGFGIADQIYLQFTNEGQNDV